MEQGINFRVNVLTEIEGEDPKIESDWYVTGIDSKGEAIQVAREDELGVEVDWVPLNALKEWNKLSTSEGEN